MILLSTKITAIPKLKRIAFFNCQKFARLYNLYGVYQNCWKIQFDTAFHVLKRREEARIVNKVNNCENKNIYYTLLVKINRVLKYLFFNSHSLPSLFQFADFVQIQARDIKTSAKKRPTGCFCLGIVVTQKCTVTFFPRTSILTQFRTPAIINRQKL